jgi:hypothetical protein
VIKKYAKYVFAFWSVTHTTPPILKSEVDEDYYHHPQGEVSWERPQESWQQQQQSVGPPKFVHDIWVVIDASNVAYHGHHQRPSVRYSYYKFIIDRLCRAMPERPLPLPPLLLRQVLSCVEYWKRKGCRVVAFGNIQTKEKILEYSHLKGHLTSWLSALLCT